LTAPPGPRPRLSLRERAAGRAAAALVTAAQTMPRERALRVAGAAGRSWARLGGPRVAAAREHLRIAFPAWTERERGVVLERSFANLARCFVELCTLGGLSQQQLRELADVDGLEHFRAVRRADPDAGVICLTAHFGSWELLIAVMAAHGIPIAVIQRPRDNPLLDTLVAELRGANGAEMLPRGNAARAALRGLRDGKVVAMTLDQNASRREGVFVPFFGRPACTRDGPARVALRTGAPVFPVFIERIGETERHRVTVHPALELAPAGSDEKAAVRENTARMTAVIEATIRRAPDQWIWTHRRWKTRPRMEEV